MAVKRLIVITSESEYPDEAKAIEMLLFEGAYRVHIRKPLWSVERMRALIADIAPEWRNRLVIHSAFSLVDEFNLGGVHLNSRSPLVPDGYRGGVSCSCHSITELREKSDSVDYCTLSPIFNSISKRGYMSGFSERELMEAKAEGVINERVFALGGVTPDSLPQLWRYGFGGACVLGYIWGDNNREEMRKRVKSLIDKTDLCFNL
jgi:thiamine-phosphate pyrophosphorylase